MAILARKTQKIFASSNTGGTDFGNVTFGSNQAGTPAASNDVAVLQSLAAYTVGWEDATLSGENLPVLGEDQALHYIETYQIAYLFQEGIAEYDAGTEYRINSVVKKAGTVDIYKSLTDANTGNALTDGTKWSLCGNLSSIPTSPALLISNNLSDLNSVSTARTSLGLGSAALLTAGSAVGNLPIIGTSGYLLKSVQRFTTSGTWTKPANINAIYVRVVGGAAGGKVCSGGGGGATGLAFLTSGFGSSQTVTIGAGGAATANGSASSFGTLITAAGGVVGTPVNITAAGSSYCGGAGGVAGGSAVQDAIAGSAGGSGAILSIAGNTITFAGEGGSSTYGGGGIGLGGAGQGYGAGGGGNPTGTEGAGTGGIIEVYEYI